MSLSSKDGRIFKTSASPSRAFQSWLRWSLDSGDTCKVMLICGSITDQIDHRPWSVAVVESSTHAWHTLMTKAYTVLQASDSQSESNWPDYIKYNDLVCSSSNSLRMAAVRKAMHFAMYLKCKNAVVLYPDHKVHTWKRSRPLLRSIHHSSGPSVEFLLLA